MTQIVSGAADETRLERLPARAVRSYAHSCDDVERPTESIGSTCGGDDDDGGGAGAETETETELLRLTVGCRPKLGGGGGGGDEIDIIITTIITIIYYWPRWSAATAANNDKLIAGQLDWLAAHA